MTCQAEVNECKSCGALCDPEETLCEKCLAEQEERRKNPLDVQYHKGQFGSYVRSTEE